jgi:flagellin
VPNCPKLFSNALFFVTSQIFLKVFTKRAMVKMQVAWSELALASRVGSLQFKEDFVMGMRIKTNVSSLIAQRQLQNNSANLSDSMQKLSTGHRINKSADDAAGLAVSTSMGAKIRGMNQAKRNANDAVSMLQVAEGAMEEMTNMTVRLRELTVQSASDTIGDRERSYLNKEYTALVDEIDRIAATTEFNGNKMFSSEKEEFVIQVGTNNSDPDENQDTVTINLAGLRFNSEDLELGKEDEIGPSEPGDSGPDRSDIAGKLENIDLALEKFSNERATLGSVQSRLNSAINNIGVSVENMSSAKSRIKDVDFASETATFAQQKILLQSGTSVLSQANIQPEMALALIR